MTYPDPGRLYTFDQMRAFAEQGWIFCDVTCLVDSERKFTVMGRADCGNGCNCLAQCGDVYAYAAESLATTKEQHD